MQALPFTPASAVKDKAANAQAARSVDVNENFMVKGCGG
jgi:hypothetical protein